MNYALSLLDAVFSNTSAGVLNSVRTRTVGLFFQVLIGEDDPFYVGYNDVLGLLPGDDFEKTLDLVIDLYVKSKESDG